MALRCFDHAGRVKPTTLANGKVYPASADMQIPYTVELADLFKLQDGKSSRNEALVTPVPYRMASGWPR